MELQGWNGKRVVAGVAIAAILTAGYVSASFVAPKGTAAAAAPLTDTEPPPTEPAPDPAPPAPKPKPTPKAAPKPKSAPTPARVYHAPTSAQTPSSAPTTRVVHHAKKKVVHRKKKQRPVQHVSVAPKPKAQVKHANVVHVAGVPTAATTDDTGNVRRTLVISGIGLAALLFLIVVVVPASAARFTAPGRVVMDHQTDFVLAGIALLVLTVLLFAATGRAA